MTRRNKYPALQSVEEDINNYIIKHILILKANICLGFIGQPIYILFTDVCDGHIQRSVAKRCLSA